LFQVLYESRRHGLQFGHAWGVRRQKDRRILEQELPMMPHTPSERIELALMVFDPAVFFPKYLRSVDDVAAHRSRVRICSYSDFAIEYLTGLVFDRVRQSRRRNLIYGLQAIKWLLRNRNENDLPIPEAIVDRLFELYQNFVFDRLDEIRWCVSAILKDKPLQSYQIRWLLDHYQESEHIVNRLLRFPRFDSVIADWARAMMRIHKLEERTSELLGRLIFQTLPPEAVQLPIPTVLWGVYHSSAESAVKQRLLEQSASADSMDDLIEISLRLHLPAILKKFVNQNSIQ